MNEEFLVRSPENKELKQQILSVFHDNKIEVDSEIKGIFDEIFNDFELATGEEDSANLYFKEDAELFESDLTINNIYEIKVNGISAGTYTATYTYCENIDYIVNEKIDLTESNKLVEELLNITEPTTSKILNKDEWCIVVTERITWENGDYTRIPRLYVYVPVSGAGIM